MSAVNTSNQNQSASSQLDEFLGRKAKPSRWSPRVWIMIVIAILLAIFLLSKILGGNKATQFVSEEVKRGDIDVIVTATGNLAPTNQVDVGSEISGIVDRVLAEVNDQVSKGQSIAIIDTARLRDNVLRSEASLASNQSSVVGQRATLKEAEAQLQRLREVSRLSNGQVPSRTEMENQVATLNRARAGVMSAEANVRSAQAQLSSDRTQLSKAIIRSPVSGVVLKRTVDPGQTVQASFNTPSLFIIAEDLKRMKLEVSIDEADVAQVVQGLQASFTVDAHPGKTFPAKITRVNLGAKNLAGSSSNTAGISNSNVVSYLATLSLENNALILRPGMTATASIRTAGEKNVLMVPNAALRFVPPEGSTEAKSKKFEFKPPRPQGTKVTQERGIGVGSEQWVYVQSEQGVLRGIKVITGQSNGRYTAVQSDELKAGMLVMTGVKALVNP
jgi:HlyD family secretion protein